MVGAHGCLRGLKGTRTAQHTPMANATHNAQNVEFIGTPGAFGGFPTGTVDALEEGCGGGGLVGVHTLVGFGWFNKNPRIVHLEVIASS